MGEEGVAPVGGEAAGPVDRKGGEGDGHDKMSEDSIILE